MKPGHSATSIIAQVSCLFPLLKKFAADLQNTAIRDIVDKRPFPCHQVYCSGYQLAANGYDPHIAGRDPMPLSAGSSPQPGKDEADDMPRPERGRGRLWVKEEEQNKADSSATFGSRFTPISPDVSCERSQLDVSRDTSY
jgi:hypothetical protein